MNCLLRILPLVSVFAAMSFAQGGESLEEVSALDTLPIVNGTSLPRTLSGFLSVDKSPYLVEDSLIVEDGKALVIQPGVVVAFKPGAFLEVRGGSLAAVGENGKPVVFRPFNKMGHWSGIRITGPNTVSFKNVVVRNAVDAIAVVNGNLDMQDALVDKPYQTGIYAEGSKVSVLRSTVSGSLGPAIWASANSSVRTDESKIFGNLIGLVADQKSDVLLNATEIVENDYGVLNMAENHVRESGSSITKNKMGLVSAEFPVDFNDAISYNVEDADGKARKLHSTLPPEPKILESTNYMSNAPILKDPEVQREWEMSGNVITDVGYHFVRTRHNHSGEDYIVGSDTVHPEGRYNNYFQTPGLFTNYNAYMMVKSPWGNSLEVIADLSSDSWNNFDVRTLSAVYTDPFQKLSLGSVNLAYGYTYMDGVDFIGGAYDLNILHNRNGDPLFVVSGFGGELQEPLLEGNKNPDLYKDWIEEGEAEAQKMFAGGKILWNMHPQFNGALGFIGSKDYVEDPFIRDGMSKNKNFGNPLMSSHTAFAEGNWIAYPGNMEFNGQIAIGAADTANVLSQRAINNVFSNAGIDASDFTLMNRLMKNPSLVSRLSSDQLIQIFGDNTMMTVSEMRAELRRLLQLAKEQRGEYAKTEYEKNRLQDWNGKNVATGASFRWTYKKSLLTSYFHFVGPRFYSAGSPDQLQNFREFGAKFEQEFSDFWKLSLTYDADVENASNENKYNVFGFNEGTIWGGLDEASDEWKKEHELDENRAINIQDAVAKNVINIGSHLELTLRYAMNYRTHHRSTRILPSYSTASGVYEDEWFRANEGKPSIKVNDTLEIDSARWLKYYEMASEPYLAADFTERLLKHTGEVNFKLKVPFNEINIGGIITYRTDLSSFADDDNLNQFDFSNSTIGKLGYRFHGGDYLEQRYPISLSTQLDGFSNLISFTPRYKKYKVEDMTDFEWTLSDNMTIELSKDFLELSLAGSVREEYLDYSNSDGNVSEEELDVDGSASLRIYFSKTFFTDWTFGGTFNYRPDYRSDEYRDVYGILSLNYAF